MPFCLLVKGIPLTSFIEYPLRDMYLYKIQKEVIIVHLPNYCGYLSP